MAARVAILGFMLESNRFAPVTTREDFLSHLYLAGSEILGELGKSESIVMAEAHGFFRAMNARADWAPVPILVARVEAGGPVEHTFYHETLAEMRNRVEAALPLDGVYVANHGAMITTESLDPDGEMLRMIREVVGPEVPVVATLDLHGNVSQEMVDAADVIISYRTNPHVDMAERGADAAAALMEMWQGMRPAAALVRLPLIAPTVTLLTSTGPYADLIRYGQTKVGGPILDVSILGGFAYADTPKNGMAIIVTARGNARAAREVARDIARHAWDDHARYRPRLTPLPEAVTRAAATGQDISLPPLILADVADNPGGGGRGNTTWILEALHTAGAQGVIMGVMFDPSLAAEAHALGVGARFRAVFNRDEPSPFSRRFEAPARVARLLDGDCVGRRGFYAGRRMDLGPSALLDLGGIQVVVVSVRTQCADPVFFEMMGLDIAEARVTVVKSRGHFRAGFDEFFGDNQVVEVDAPGLTSPILSRFGFRDLPRPAFPLDEHVSWAPPSPDQQVA